VSVQFFFWPCLPAGGKDAPALVRLVAGMAGCAVGLDLFTLLISDATLLALSVQCPEGMQQVGQAQHVPTGGLI
jgi:hypothetical protein